jgi:hypothetical protein
MKDNFLKLGILGGRDVPFDTIIYSIISHTISFFGERKQYERKYLFFSYFVAMVTKLLC